jgi:hypothetical protein
MSARSRLIIIFIALFFPVVNAENLPDPNFWFIQQLTGDEGGGMIWNLEVSDSMVAWDSDDGAFYYDGTGVYELIYGSIRGSTPSVSGNNIACLVSPPKGIVHYNGQVKRFVPRIGLYYCTGVEVYQDSVVWSEGDTWMEEETMDVFLNDGTSTSCLTENEQCWFNGSYPEIAENAVVWQSYDGNDFEIFLQKEGVTCQLTNNDVGDWLPIVSNNGHVAWLTDHGYGYHAYYYDGIRIRQLTAGTGYAALWGISDTGVLYSYCSDDTGEYKTSLYFFDGIQSHTLYEFNGTGELISAALGGESVAWTVSEKVYLYKDGQITTWDGSDWGPENEIGVWGNRIVWRNYEDYNLYFAEYLGSPACTNPLTMDGNDDCKVDLADFMLLASQWLRCGYDLSGACP